MKIILGILGALFGLLLQFALPWSQIVMTQVNTLLANPSISHFPGLPVFVTAVGILLAYILLPFVGFALGSRS